jgi:hypothetical protein
MHRGPKVGQANAPYVDKWNLKSRTRLQRHQLLHNSLYQGMVLSMSAGLQVGNVNLPVLRRWLQILGVPFSRHNLSPCLAKQNTKAEYLVVS